MKVNPSPCRICIVNIMCKRFCEEANKYAQRNDYVDIYIGRVVARYLKWEIKVNPSTGRRNFYLGGMEEKIIEDGDLLI